MAENNYDKTVDERQTDFKAKLIATLKELPIIEAACKRAGIGRDTYYRWRRDDKVFRKESEDALNQGIEFVSDMSESQLITLIKDKKMPAIAMWLKNNHPRYGSKARSYTPMAPVEDLTDEEQKIVLEALAMASGATISKKNGKHNTGISRPD